MTGGLALCAVAAMCLAGAPLSAQRTDSLAVTTSELGARLRLLSSDLFEGRYPGTHGEALTTAYLVSELQGFGALPGGASAGRDSSAQWLQPVTILTYRRDSTSPNTARLSGRVTRTLEHGREIRFAAYSDRADVETGGELVFAGYGIDAPIYQWNDFDGVDLRGKIVVALPGEPALHDDPTAFNGVRASRYLWPSEKIRAMRERGAIGVLWIRPAGTLQRGPVTGTRRLLSAATGDSIMFAGGISDSVVASLLPPGSLSFRALIAAANARGVRAIPLGVRLDLHFRTVPTPVTTHNVVATVRGHDPALAREHVVLSAHWDAYGIGPAVAGDSIYNGALDDGAGTTSLLALARVFARRPQRRSITFLFATAEEWGLLGSTAFACEGPIPAARIVASLNLDNGLELLGPTRDVAPLGIELSSLGATVAQVARRAGLTVSPDPAPSEGYFLRADNFPFALAGVPSLYMGLGMQLVKQRPEYVKAKVDEYLARHYHRPSDEYDTVALDLTGSKQFTEFVRDVTIDVANAHARPEWNRSAEFQRAGTAAGRCTR